VLLDFGLASRLASQALTRSDTILGTVPYMAPERLRGDRGSPSVDVWSAGLLLYEMLLGRLPWKNPNDLSLVNEILSSQSLPIAARIEPVAGAAVARLAADMLAYQPRERPADGAALLARVAQVMGDSPAAAGRGRPTTPPTAPVARPAGK
jgi:serine/threonine-protein kinase